MTQKLIRVILIQEYDSGADGDAVSAMRSESECSLGLFIPSGL